MWCRPVAILDSECGMLTRACGTKVPSTRSKPAGKQQRLGRFDSALRPKLTMTLGQAGDQRRPLSPIHHHKTKMNNLGTSLIIAAAIGASAYFLTHLHSVVPTQTGVYAYVINHVTGSVKICAVPGCNALGANE